MRIENQEQSTTHGRDIKDNFIQALEKRIDASKNVFIFGDKTSNLYKIEASTYNKLVTKNVTKTCKHVKDNTMNEITKELKNIADKLNISKLIDPVNNNPAFITLNDHKLDFENHPKCRLINPFKSQL